MRNFDLGIRCEHFLSMKGGIVNPEKDIFIGISDGIIREVSPWEPSKKNSCKEFLDGTDRIVMPGLVNGHTHLPMTLFRGLEDDSSFHHWLFERIIPLEVDLVDPEFIQVGTQLAALECMRFGVTTVNEMYFFAREIAKTWDQAGLRGLIGQGFTGYTCPEDRFLGTDKEKLFKELFEQFKGHERIVPSLCPHSPYTCDDAALQKVAELSQTYQVPIHIHLSETQFEVESSLKKYGKTPVKRLQEFGVLSPRTIAAHCVHLNEEDRQIMKETGSSIAHNPDSNLKLGSGVAPISAYRKLGIPVAFGTDGAASNNDLSLFAALDLGTKLQKWSTGNSMAMGATDALSCATFEGAKALGLEKKVGSLEVGKEADLILIDVNHPNLQPIYDIRSQLIYSMAGHEVDTVVCRGKILMKGKQFTTLDADKIYANARKIANQVKTHILEMDQRKK